MIYIYIHLHIHIHTYIYIYTCTYTYIYIHMYIYIYTYIHFFHPICRQMRNPSQISNGDFLRDIVATVTTRRRFIISKFGLRCLILFILASPQLPLQASVIFRHPNFQSWGPWVPLGPLTQWKWRWSALPPEQQDIATVLLCHPCFSKEMNSLCVELWRFQTGYWWILYVCVLYIYIYNIIYIYIYII